MTNEAEPAVTMGAYYIENADYVGVDLYAGALQAVRQIGCDGIEEVEYLERPLSTVVQPAGEMCALSCRFLHARLDDPSVPPQQAILQPELVIRQSSRP